MNLLPLHHAHDTREVMRRWAVLKKKAALHATELASVEGHAVMALESPAAKRGQPAIYLSAGVHGDEPGSVWGLLLWAEKNISKIRHGSFLLLPLLNPIGLMLNTRADHRGLDINRRFHLMEDPLSAAWHAWIKGRHILAGLCLHEDYDARGCYVYELGPRGGSLGREILARCAQPIPTDPRTRIDGQRTSAGLIRRKKLPDHLPGMPEAIELHLCGCPLTLTFETPSEFSLDDRTITQMRFIHTALEVIQA
jgi:protein MpaA